MFFFLFWGGKFRSLSQWDIRLLCCNNLLKIGKLFCCKDFLM